MKATHSTHQLSFTEQCARRCLADVRMDLIKEKDLQIERANGNEARGTFEHAPLLSIIENIEKELNRFKRA